MKLKSGFTLIELMVVVAIVAILSVVALPSYQGYVQDGRRAECKAFALDIASRQERNWTQNSTFAADNAFIAALNMPNGRLSQNSYCSASTTGGNTFTITVTMNPPDTECNPLTLTNTGLRRVSPDAANAVQCWR